MCLQVEGILHLWILCRLPVPVLHLLLLDQVGHHQICANGNVFWLHGDYLLQLLLYDRHNWVLCVLDICAANICCGQNRLMNPVCSFSIVVTGWSCNKYVHEVLLFATVELTSAGKAFQDRLLLDLIFFHTRRRNLVTLLLCGCAT